MSERVHGPTCRCAPCRHGRFEPGPPSMTKRQRRNRDHEEALEMYDAIADGRAILLDPERVEP